MTSRTLADPTQPVTAGWVVRFSLAWIGLYAGLFGPLEVLLPQQIAQLAPADKEATLALVLGAGAACSLVANPLFGALSDRTRSRFGRRRPWIALGFAGGAVAIALLAAAPTVPFVVLGWCAVQTLLNAPFAALSAAVPDEVPAAQRGTAAGYLGLAFVVGIGAGAGLAVLGGATATGYLLCALVALLCSLPYILLGRHTPYRPDTWRWGEFLRGFWINPVRHPDFGWGFLTRFLVNLGNAVVLLYLFFFLSDVVGLADPASGVLVLTAIYSVAMLGSVVVAGPLSDRLARRRVFVTGGALVMAAAAVLISVWPVWAGVVVAAVALGIGFGAYSAVDFALLTQVLPAARDRGKDLGVLNIASSLPQVLAPVIAAPIVTGLGGYAALYLVAAAIEVTGAVLVYRIRSVR
ncbi:MFS transporter [Pseudonocardia sp. DSM 110487]|uniref:MFS transporter n=1 Tax=Pseudonocardia sp. DSM 110487 TaxID=2865833 RepID=UPI001C69A54F|nr:MFS transporter [Pseudonocardia sp. DSM 110487]QYN32341.1 MFS transporter [Pseudonocardia sp. DSM 110487]